VTSTSTTAGSKNSRLAAAKAAKNDEFYTQWADIEREMNAYLEYDPDVFRDKVILHQVQQAQGGSRNRLLAVRQLRRHRGSVRRRHPQRPPRDNGRPDTFLDKYNPDQFVIIGNSDGYSAAALGVTPLGPEYVGNVGRTKLGIASTKRAVFKRIIIRRKAES
jgi:hypothetical protein